MTPTRLPSSRRSTRCSSSTWHSAWGTARLAGVQAGGSRSTAACPSPAGSAWRSSSAWSRRRPDGPA
eukprot:3272858-Lingulodinium_polyedra.AAC.1